MTEPRTTTGKAIAADPDIFLAWSYLIRKGKLPDRGMRFSPQLTEQTGDGRHVYTFPTHLESAVIRDFDTVQVTYAGTEPSPLWTPN